MATGGYAPAVRRCGNEQARNPVRVVHAWDLGDPPEALALARSLVREALGELSVTGEAADDILLAADELVVNACEHGSGPRELRISGDVEALRCEVVDADLAHWPVLAPPDGPAARQGPEAPQAPAGAQPGDRERRGPRDADPVRLGPGGLDGLDAFIAALAEHGRGLGLVRRLCDRCGVHRTELLTAPAVAGKAVWFTRSLGRDHGARPQTPAGEAV
jgi:anti-sigma regulatory factor (Ser/Thr protein kinase)